MKKINLVITDPLGIHARPAGLLVKKAMGFESAIVLVNKENKRADAKKLFSVMGLAIKCADCISIEVEGADEEKVAWELLDFAREVLACRIPEGNA